MRRACALLLAALLLVFGGAAAMTKAYLAQRDAVELELETLYGDASALEGLSFKLNTSYSNVYWTTTGRFDQLDSIETESECRMSDETDTGVEQFTWLSLSNYNAIESVRTYFESDRIYMSAFYHDEADALADSIGAGESAFTTVKASDIQKYYLIAPVLFIYKSVEINGEITDVGVSATWNDMDDYLYLLEEEEQEGVSNVWVEEGSDWSSKLAIIAALNDYFRIPVLENEYYTLGVEKDEDGQIAAQSLTNGFYDAYQGDTSDTFYADTEAAKEALSGTADAYTMTSFSADSADGFYFTFSTLTEKGNCVDVSELPDGYGIFYLPFLEDDTSFTVDSSAISMVYALDVGTQILNLEVNQSRNQLLLFTAEDGKDLLTVIDLGTMSAVQRLTLSEYEGDDYGITVKTAELENGLLVVSDGELLYVLTVGEDGSYVIAMQCPLEENTYVSAMHERYPQKLSYYDILYTDIFCFDGGRLALVCKLNNGNCESVLVYDETGLVCFSLLTSSLNELHPEGEAKSCSLADITIDWDGTA